MSRDHCSHGETARECLICEKNEEIAELRAEVARLRESCGCGRRATVPRGYVESAALAIALYLATWLLAGCTTSACCPSPAVAWSLYAGPGEHVVAIRANGLELPAKIIWTGPGAATGSQALPVPSDGGALDYAPGGCVREVAVEVIAGGAVDGAAWAVCQ